MQKTKGCRFGGSFANCFKTLSVCNVFCHAGKKSSPKQATNRNKKTKRNPKTPNPPNQPKTARERVPLKIKTTRCKDISVGEVVIISANNASPWDKARLESASVPRFQIWKLFFFFNAHYISVMLFSRTRYPQRTQRRKKILWQQPLVKSAMNKPLAQEYQD